MKLKSKSCIMIIGIFEDLQYSVFILFNIQGYLNE